VWCLPFFTTPFRWQSTAQPHCKSHSRYWRIAQPACQVPPSLDGFLAFLPIPVQRNAVIPQLEFSPRSDSPLRYLFMRTGPVNLLRSLFSRPPLTQNAFATRITESSSSMGCFVPHWPPGLSVSLTEFTARFLMPFPFPPIFLQLPGSLAVFLPAARNPFPPSYKTFGFITVDNS